MTMILGKGYAVRHQATAPTVPCSCGQSTRILTAADTPTCSLHVTFIRQADLHYHRRTTEVYYILDGTGSMELNGDQVTVEPGTVIYIEPNTRHRILSDQGVQTIVFAIPAFDPTDEYYD